MKYIIPLFIAGLAVFLAGCTSPRGGAYRETSAEMPAYSSGEYLGWPNYPEDRGYAELPEFRGYAPPPMRR